MLRTGLILAGILTGCSPVSYHFKEKVVERFAPPRPAIQVDRFVVGQAFGPVDVLFVVDNSRSIEAGLEKFQETYQRFLSLWSNPEVRQVDYRVQVVTTPKPEIPPHWVQKGSANHDHLRSLFDFGDSSSALFSKKQYRQSGSLQPDLAVAKGLADKAFEGRAFVPLFLVFVLGDDISSSGTRDLQESLKNFQTAFATTRNFKNSHVLSITRTTATGNFPHCRDFYEAHRFQGWVGQLPWRNVQEANLCDVNWSSWQGRLFNEIVKFKKGIFLTQTPFQPSSLSVRSGSTLYRFGDHYDWNPATNAIEFKPGLGPGLGELLEVSYFLTPVAPEFSGSPTPFLHPGMKR